MGAEALDAQLRLIAGMNGGPDTQCTYTFRELAGGPDLMAALRSEFTPGTNYRTKKTFSFEDWHVQLKAKSGTLRETMLPVFEQWTFQMPYSPSSLPVETG